MPSVCSTGTALTRIPFLFADLDPDTNERVATSFRVDTDTPKIEEPAGPSKKMLLGPFIEKRSLPPFSEFW